MHAVVEKLREIESSPPDEMFARLKEVADRLDLKDGYARDHTVEVSRLASGIASELGVTGEQLRHVELGALLHDIGKISVPDRILTKPAPLTELEWTVMRRHALTGEQLLLRILDLPDVLAIVRSHHERWDGRGYPDGKRGNDIPLAARIVAVADAFQAMIEPRPYRRPLSRETALGEVCAQSALQFDPACVKALCAAVSVAGGRQPRPN
jgi:putative two-component system response regulator